MKVRVEGHNDPFVVSTHLQEDWIIRIELAQLAEMDGVDARLPQNVRGSPWSSSSSFMGHDKFENAIIQ